MQLTTNWQNVKSYEYRDSRGFRCTFYLDAKYSIQSKENNTTTVQTRLNCVLNNGSGAGTGYRFTLSYANTREGSELWTIETETILLGEQTIQHNADGTKTISLSASMRVNYTGIDASMSVDVDLPKIDRYPLIVTAPNFSDEDDPTITYTTNLGFANATVETCIASADGNTIYVPYRAVNVNNGSYTFNLTTEERNILRNATPNNNKMNVKFYLRTTTSNNTKYYSSVTKELNIINANPTFTYTMAETNSKVSALLGASADTIIKNASILSVTVSFDTYKYATSKVINIKQGIEGDTSLSYSYPNPTSPHTFNNVYVFGGQNDGKFILSLTDSRNNKTTQTETQKTIIEYQPVDITKLSLKRVNPTSSNIVLNLEAIYYQETFGSTANVPVVKWKLGDGSYTTIPSTEYTIDTTNHKLTITNYTLSNALVYTSTGTFTLSIEDLLTSDTDAREVLKGIPTFDAGEHDLKVNGDLYVADQNGQNKKLVATQTDIVIDGNPVKTGRTINGKDEYILWMNLGYAPNNTSKKVATNIPMSNLYFVSEMGGMGYRSSDTNWFVLNASRLDPVWNIMLSGSVTDNSQYFAFYLETRTDRSSIYCYAYVKFTYVN